MKCPWFKNASWPSPVGSSKGHVCYIKLRLEILLTQFLPKSQHQLDRPKPSPQRDSHHFRIPDEEPDMISIILMLQMRGSADHGRVKGGQSPLNYQTQLLACSLSYTNTNPRQQMHSPTITCHDYWPGLIRLRYGENTYTSSLRVAAEDRQDWNWPPWSFCQSYSRNSHIASSIYGSLSIPLHSTNFFFSSSDCLFLHSRSSRILKNLHLVLKDVDDFFSALARTTSNSRLWSQSI